MAKYCYRKALYKGKRLEWMIDSVQEYPTKSEAVKAAHKNADEAAEGLEINDTKYEQLNEPFGATIWYRDTEGNCYRMDFDVMEVNC